MVSEFPLPDPPKTPPEKVLPGETVNRLVPSEVIRAATLSEDA
jgi:hypothetical protein